ncbi:MAG: hypothetical protein MJ025_05905, partial [Victivallaceae bacterium]|nr:hypothetical protein [Victivallaceae bacterium]
DEVGEYARAAGERLTSSRKKLRESRTPGDSYGTCAEKDLLGIGVKPEELQALRDIMLEK